MWEVKMWEAGKGEVETRQVQRREVGWDSTRNQLQSKGDTSWKSNGAGPGRVNCTKSNLPQGAKQACLWRMHDCLVK